MINFIYGTLGLALDQTCLEFIMANLSLMYCVKPSKYSELISQLGSKLNQ